VCERSGSRRLTRVFATGLLLRPVLIAPVAPSGLLAGSFLLPIGLAGVLAFHVVIAALVFAGNRTAIAFGVLTALVGPFLAAIGVIAGLPMPWPAALGAYNVVLVVVGIASWQETLTGR
jgi:hypothetical protein